jgi:hypothetical protein
MNDMEWEELTTFGRSWAYAPEASVKGSRFNSAGYDRSERCYQFENTSGKAGKLSFTLDGSIESPVHHPAFYIKNWNAEGAVILVDGNELKDCRKGILHGLDGTDLVVFLDIQSNTSVEVTIQPD